MGFFLFLVELLFALSMVFILVLFGFSMNLAWAWAQHQKSESSSFADIISAAAIEWGAILHMVASHFISPKVFYQAPPLADETKVSPQQLPVVFVPSLRTGPSIFLFLIWRLKKNFWNSLWPFEWKSFLKDPRLLEDQLFQYIQDITHRTGAKRFRIVSFGSSRPIISSLLSREDLSAYCDRWIAISAPKKLAEAYLLLRTPRVKLAYEELSPLSKREPDLLVTGENDIFCYPSDVWGEGQRLEF